MKSAAKVEFGDFQTPLPLAREVCDLLRRLGITPSAVIEPTCGVGAFLQAASEAFPGCSLTGFELNPAHAAVAAALPIKARVVTADFFTHDWQNELSEETFPLLLGNPPWVTNAAVSVVSGGNLPTKENIYGLRGLAAKTGKANFDIAEWIILRLIQARRERPAVLAVLCKTATARKVLRHAWRGHHAVHSASLYLIDAQAQFGAAVDACLLLAHLGQAGKTEANIFLSLHASAPVKKIGLAGADLVADLDAYRSLQSFEGLSPFQWRSGIKHDCASVLELSHAADGTLQNKSGETVDVEPEALFPWCKSTALVRQNGATSQRFLLPQASLAIPAELYLAQHPRALTYLQAHVSDFGARKSSIYKRGGPFAIFGVGDYAFLPWKVAVSALHRPVKFTVVGPADGRPVLFDDTCYYIPFQKESHASFVANVLNSDAATRFLDALIFPGAKRAVTAELLHRLNFAALADAASLSVPSDLFKSVRSSQPEDLLAFGT